MSTLNGHGPKPKPEKVEKEKKGISKVSKKMRSSKKLYNKLRIEFLTANPICQVDGCRYRATQVHHMRGRLGDLLCDVTHFLAVCHPHHQKIEISPTWAKEHGYSESRLEVNDVTIYK